MTAMVKWLRCILVAALLASATVGAAGARRALVYAAIGPELRAYELDPDSATLSPLGSVTLPADIQAGCVQPDGRQVFVAWSDGTNVSAGSQHGLSAFRFATGSGQVQAIGDPVALPSRPIHCSIDPAARHTLVAYTSPSGVTVHPLGSDGAAGPPLMQPPLMLGIYGHQILVAPNGRMAILVARGNVPTASRKEDPGALDVLDYRNGLLGNKAAIAPNGGFGFHPRYLDFHPSRPWVYVSLSQQNAIGVYGIRKDGSLDAERLFEKSSLADATRVHPGQLTGALHIHPNGRFVYLANRAINATEDQGKPVFAGGENSIAVFGIDRRSGEPTLLQVADTHGIGPAEFAFAADGRMLVVANMRRLWVAAAGTLTPVPPSLVLFRVRTDGRLDFVRKYDVESGDRSLFWMGLGSLPQDLVRR